VDIPQQASDSLCIYLEGLTRGEQAQGSAGENERLQRQPMSARTDTLAEFFEKLKA
jgi:hypothetical protein